MAPSATADTPPSYQSLKSIAHEKCYRSVLYDVRDLHYEETDIPSPGPDELQITIKATGICGSDVSYYQKRCNGDIRCGQGKLCLGHESSGVVASIGSQVEGFKIGDRVALEVGVPCGSCGICRKGRYNLCKKMMFRSSAKSDPPYQGTLQERLNHPAMWCHKIPDSVSFEAAALLEPLSVAIHATNRAALTTASSCLVIGAGTVGLLTAAMALQAGCTSVTIMDVDGGRVNYAMRNGFATHGYKVPCESSSTRMHHSTSNTCAPQSPDSSSPCTPSTSGSSTPESGSIRTTPLSSFSDIDIDEQLRLARNLALDVLSLTQDIPSSRYEAEHIGVDCTFECTGKQACMQTALYATKPGGRVIMVGMGTPIQTLPISAAHLREVDILGIFRYCNTYTAGIRLLESGRLPNLGNMVTHRFKGLKRAREAFELAGRTKDDEGELVLKVVIEC